MRSVRIVFSVLLQFCQRLTPVNIDAWLQLAPIFLGLGCSWDVVAGVFIVVVLRCFAKVGFIGGMKGERKGKGWKAFGRILCPFFGV